MASRAPTDPPTTHPTLVVIDPPDYGAARAVEAVGSLPAEGSLAAFDTLYIRHPRRWLAAILLAYVAAAVLFATVTPAWQAPDEPAHYNYVTFIAQTGTLPVLRDGDYNQALLDQLLSNRFAAPAAAPAALRYEAHQPPLYYLLATPVYWLSDGALWAMRLFSILIGAASILLLYLSLELVFPGKPLIVVGGTAFAALLPMHVALSAAVNNDGLAEALILAAMLVLLDWLRRQFYGDAGDAAGETVAASDDAGTAAARRSRRQLLLLGVLLGLGMLTKVYAYMLAPIVVLVTVGIAARCSYLGKSPAARTVWGSIRVGVQHGLLVALPALALALPWWVRNSIVYGGWDVLGMAQHNRVVVGQPRTLEWVALNGWMAYGERAFSFTFKSFWGVFGWMGVFMDERIYTALQLFTGVLFLGLLWAMVRFISGPPDTDMDAFQMFVLAVFGVMLLAVTASFAWYNAQFVQHQGRYFFWGLLPISTLVALGWREVMQPLQGVITGVLALVLTAGIALASYATGILDKWALLAAALIALTLVAQPLLLAGTHRYGAAWLSPAARARLDTPAAAFVLAGLRAWVWALPFVLLFALDLAIPYAFIVPQLVDLAK